MTRDRGVLVNAQRSGPSAYIHISFHGRPRVLDNEDRLGLCQHAHPLQVINPLSHVLTEVHTFILVMYMIIGRHNRSAMSGRSEEWMS